MRTTLNRGGRIPRSRRNSQNYAILHPRTKNLITVLSYMETALHAAFRKGSGGEAEQLELLSTTPDDLKKDDGSWEGWLPLHHAARWGTTLATATNAIEAYPEAAKAGSKGGYEPLHLAAMGGHADVVSALVAVYPEGVMKKDGNGRTPLDEAREGGHDAIVATMLELPGVREADAAEREVRASRDAELMQNEDTEPTVAAVSSEAEEEDDDEYDVRRSANNSPPGALIQHACSPPVPDGFSAAATQQRVPRSTCQAQRPNSPQRAKLPTSPHPPCRRSPTASRAAAGYLCELCALAGFANVSRGVQCPLAARRGGGGEAGGRARGAGELFRRARKVHPDAA